MILLIFAVCSSERYCLPVKRSSEGFYDEEYRENDNRSLKQSS